MADDGRELDIEPTGSGATMAAPAGAKLLRRTSEARPARSRAGTRICASRPRRVFLAWLAIFAGLIVLVVTIGGGLKDKFEIPGSDTQKATDLIKSPVRVRGGLRPEPRLRRATGPASRHSRAQAGHRGRRREAQGDRVQAEDGQGGDRQCRRPVREADVLEERTNRVRRGAVLGDDRDRRSIPGSRCRGCRARGGGAGWRGPPSSTARRSRRRSNGEVPGAARVHGRLHRAPDRLPHPRRDLDPDRARPSWPSGRRSSCSSSSPG